MNFMQAVEQCFLGKKCHTKDNGCYVYMVLENDRLIWKNKSDDTFSTNVTPDSWIKRKSAEFEFYDPQPKITEFEIGVIYKRKDCQVYNSIIQLDDNNYMVLNIDDLTYWHGTKKEVLAHLNNVKFVKKQS